MVNHVKVAHKKKIGGNCVRCGKPTKVKKTVPKKKLQQPEVGMHYIEGLLKIRIPIIFGKVEITGATF